MDTGQPQVCKEETILDMARELRDSLGGLRIKLDSSFGTATGTNCEKAEVRPSHPNILEEILEIQTDTRETIAGIRVVVDAVIRKVH